MKTEKPITLAHFFDRMIHENPKQVISTFKDEINVFTIEELNHKANLLAKGLVYIGVGKSTPVALVLSGTTNCLTFVVALSKIGAVLVPVSNEIDILKFSNILKIGKVNTVGFYADQFLERFKKIIPNYLESERGYINNSTFPNLKNVVTFGSIKNRGIFTTRELMLLGEHTDDFEIEELSAHIAPSDVFIRSFVFDKKNKLNISETTHGDIINEHFSISALQNFVLNAV